MTLFTISGELIMWERGSALQAAFDSCIRMNYNSHKMSDTIYDFQSTIPTNTVHK